MKRPTQFKIIAFLLFISCLMTHKNVWAQKIDKTQFPAEMVDFVPYNAKPVFKGTGSDTWDQKIRERGYILFGHGGYKMWYTGYNGDDTVKKYLGYATS